MKNLIIVALIVTICSCTNTTPNNKATSANSGEQSATVSLKEEQPPLRISKSEMGKLKMHENGYSIGEKTELTELLKYLNNNDFDVIEIIWVWDCSPKYGDMPMKIVYDKTNGSLKEIYTSTNVKEEYTNIGVDCLKQFLQNGEKSLYSISDYCKDAKFEFNNREMKVTALGPKPDQSELDGSVKIVKDYIKSNAKDASSIDFLEWSKVTSIGNNWVVRCKYKGTNSFNSIVTGNAWFYIQNNQVVNFKDIQ